MFDSKKVKAFFAVAFMCSCLVFPRAFQELKILLLLCFFASSVFDKDYFVNIKLSFFYLIIMFVGVLWAIVGLLNDSYFVGVVDGFKLYFIWSIIFLLFYNALLKLNAISLINKAVFIAGFLVSSMNLVFVASSANGIGLFPQFFLDAMQMRIGFHEYYVQLTSHNIGMLFFITPYLVVALFYRRFNFKIVHYGILALCLLAVALSGRRALWLVVAITPLLMVAYFLFIGKFFWLRWNRLTSFFLISLMLFIFWLLQLDGMGTLEHLLMAFSSEDERSIQGPYLIKGFIENPFFGSGFGGYAGYTRSETSPWLYEMTYHQLLFNLGVLGISILVALFGYYSFKICLFSRRLDSDAVYLPSIAVGLLGLAIGSYSNPYLGSFDFLLLVGFLPVVVAHYGKQRFF